MTRTGLRNNQTRTTIKPRKIGSNQSRPVGSPAAAKKILKRIRQDQRVVHGAMQTKGKLFRRFTRSSWGCFPTVILSILVVIINSNSLIITSSELNGIEKQIQRGTQRAGRSASSNGASPYN